MHESRGPEPGAPTLARSSTVRLALAAVAVLATVAAPGGMSAVQPAPPRDVVTIDFEDLSTTGPGQGGQVRVTSQYSSRGVVFLTSPVALDYSRAQSIPGFAHSGTRAIEQCYAQEFCRTPFEFRLRRPQSRVRMWVGYRAPLDGDRIVVAQAFGQQEQLLDSDRVVLSGSGNVVPIRTPLQVATDAPRIVRVRVGVTGDLFSSSLALDDLEFEAAAERVGPEPQEPEEPPSAPRPVVVPNLVDMTMDSAGRRLRAEGLTLGSVRPEASTDHRPGRVVSQTIPPDTEVRPGTDVGVVVAIPSERDDAFPQEKRRARSESQPSTDSRTWPWWVLGTVMVLAAAAFVRHRLRRANSPPDIEARVAKGARPRSVTLSDRPEVTAEIVLRPRKESRASVEGAKDVFVSEERREAER